MVANLLLPIGGIEAALVPLSLSLKEKGHQVVIYVVQPIQYPNQNAEALRQGNVTVVNANATLVSLANFGIKWRVALIRWLGILATPFLWVPALFDAVLKKRSFKRSLQGAVGKFRGLLTQWFNFESWYYLDLARLFQKMPPSVVHVHGWGCGEDPPGVLKWLRQFNHPVIYTEHNSPDPKIHQEILNAPMNLAHVLIAVSQAGRAGLIEVGHASRPIEVIPYSVDSLSWPPPARKPNPNIIMTCVARLAQQKGHENLLAAMPSVLEQVPQARLVLAGAGPLRQNLEDQVKALNLHNQVQLIGSITRADLPNLLANADIFVLSSHWEGLPIALIEAMSAGKALVVTRVGGNPELVVDGQNGLVVPPADPLALAAALVALALDYPRRQAMGEASRRLFEAGGFSRSEVMEKTLGAYRQAIVLAGMNQ